MAQHPVSELSRRAFLKTTAIATGALALEPLRATDPISTNGVGPVTIHDLPSGGSPAPVLLPHFPDRVHAFVWRNWALVPIERMAKVLGAATSEIAALGNAMGLPTPPPISPDQQRRSSITIIRRNWHLLPYQQLLELLDWTPAQLAFTLREDDFLFIKLGSLKPKCEPLWYAAPTPAIVTRQRQIAESIAKTFPPNPAEQSDPLFGFIHRLSEQTDEPKPTPSGTQFAPRFCYSYFALYGDPLLSSAADSYPAGYLSKLAASGVDGIWLQAVLQKLAPFPWDVSLSTQHDERLANLQRLVQRARAQGLGVYLYLNEPRSMPLSFFADRPGIKGTVEGAHACLCTSAPAVQRWMTASVAAICRAVPELAGFFTISASENLTNCWSHGGGSHCPRCRDRSASDVIAEVHTLVQRGIHEAASRTQLIAWDWGWADAWAEDAIAKLPDGVALMSVSEWSTPIRRGGIEAQVGEYSLSTIGPGPRAQKHWAAARKRGLKTIAKIQAANTWELSAVPYIPAVENTARHAANLRNVHVDGLMLGWTLGGYPSPNIEVVMEIARTAVPAGANVPDTAVVQAMHAVAERRFGASLAPAVVTAWREFSAAFAEFPFDGGLVYNAPMQYGPSNLLWAEPTGYHATMVGFPYDDLDSWRGPYPVDIFIEQFVKVANGFDRAIPPLRLALEAHRDPLSRSHRQNAVDELNVAEAAAIHFRTTANQARFVQMRRALASAKNAAARTDLQKRLKELIQAEADLARRLFWIQRRDSRIGFEASNQYYYVPVDLMEKVLNCQWLLDTWLPKQLM